MLSSPPSPTSWRPLPTPQFLVNHFRAFISIPFCLGTHCIGPAKSVWSWVWSQVGSGVERQLKTVVCPLPESMNRWWLISKDWVPWAPSFFMIILRVQSWVNPVQVTVVICSWVQRLWWVSRMTFDISRPPSSYIFPPAPPQAPLSLEKLSYLVDNCNSSWHNLASSRKGGQARNCVD